MIQHTFKMLIFGNLYVHRVYINDGQNTLKHLTLLRDKKNCPAFLLVKDCFWAREMSQRVKALAAVQA